LKLEGFTFYITEDCNFHCAYCYQKKRNRYLKLSSIKRAVDFLWPHLNRPCNISFYGGEPMLAFDVIEKTLRYIQKIEGPHEDISYHIATNGSIIDHYILDVLDEFKFNVTISYDGMAQETFRGKESLRQVVGTIEEINRRPNIRLETRSIFTPSTVGLLSESIKSIVCMGIESVHLNFADDYPWEKDDLMRLQDELTDLREFSFNFYRETNTIPCAFFQEKPGFGLGRCNGAETHMSLTPDDRLWGCHLFFDYAKLRKDDSLYRLYSFGRLDNFIKNYDIIFPEIQDNYKKISQRNCWTSEKKCRECRYIFSCSVCPLDASFSSPKLWEIPIWVCEIKKISWEAMNLFWKEMEDCESKKDFS
jgi:sulfatase maturation enzyme AslB (radical SAM superfamily)